MPTIASRTRGDSDDIDHLITTDQPKLTGGIRHVNTQRHAGYVESTAYRKYLSEVRKKLGWPELQPGSFDAVRAR